MSHDEPFRNAFADDTSGVDAGFGCSSLAWKAELNAMSIGAEEGHIVLPLEEVG